MAVFCDHLWPRLLPLLITKFHVPRSTLRCRFSSASSQASMDLTLFLAVTQAFLYHIVGAMSQSTADLKSKIKRSHSQSPLAVPALHPASFSACLSGHSCPVSPRNNKTPHKLLHKNSAHSCSLHKVHFQAPFCKSKHLAKI